MPDFAHEWTDERIEGLERRMAREYRRAAKEMRQKLDDAMSAFDVENRRWKERLSAGEVDAKAYKNWLKAQSVSQTFILDLAQRLAADATMTNAKVRELINDELPSVYAENANFAAYDIQRAAGFDTHSFDLYDESTVRHIMALDEHEQIMHEVIPIGPPVPDYQSLRVNLDAVKDVRWNRQKFNSAIVQSVLQGESIPHAARRLNNVLNMNRRMAVRAARTALTSAENAGRVDSYVRAQRMGIKLEQQWVATFDERTRLSHRELHGQHVPVGGYFTAAKTTGNSLRYPADPAAAGEETWNCRCTLRPYLEGMEQEERPLWTNWKDGTTYEQWLRGEDARTINIRRKGGRRGKNSSRRANRDKRTD